ncbi:DUF1963 domain-containing protein [Streptomyces sp. NPDC001288]|uniref:DUF1963 domain-containing protein n=1 Tax=Streptomyces sp. NPDC001297 TaxID=3364559 RepID=UPI0036CE0386
MENPLEVDMYQPVMDVLGPEMGEHWRARTRPAIALTAQKSDGAIVGQLYGLPSLPADVPWPVWEGHGPMTHLATIDCAALPQGVLDFDMPTDGSLLFFRWTAEDMGRSAAVSGEWHEFLQGHGASPESGVKILHIPTLTDTALRPTPHGYECTAARPLHLVGTFASRLDYWYASTEYSYDEKGYELAEAFDQWQEHELFDSQIGGHQCPMHVGSVEKVVGGDLRGPYGTQINEDAMMMLASFWDYEDGLDASWFIKPRDLARRDFDKTYFDVQPC